MKTHLRCLRTLADFVLLMIGYQAHLTLCKMAGIELLGDCQTPRHDPRTMESNVPGIYVAGTTVGGTQDKFTLFIENCHVHVQRILSALTGTSPPAEVTAQTGYDRPES